MADKVAKITISLPAELLAEIDELAAGDRESRSFVIREAATQYVAHKRDTDSAAVRKRGVDAAIALMREVSGMPASDDRSSLELLRELRDNDDFIMPTVPNTKSDGGHDE